MIEIIDELQLQYSWEIKQYQSATQTERYRHREEIEPLKTYDTFRNALKAIPSSQHSSPRSAALQILWREFPRWHDLEDRVGNAENPGDGFIYDKRRVARANTILQDLYNAWLDTDALHASPPPANLKEEGKICLILTGMRKQELLEDFLDRNCTDNDLPLQMSELETVLKPQNVNYAATFAAEQFRAVPRQWEAGDHLAIRDTEALPLTLERDLGAGSYGEACSVQDCFSGVKYINKRQRFDSEYVATESRDHLVREANCLRRLRHRHILQFVKTYERGNMYGILLKPVATGDLQILIKRYRRNKFNPQNRSTDSVWLRSIFLTAFGCLSLGLAYLHERNVRHKDIKPSNILFEDASKTNGDTPRFLLAGFGLADDFNKTASRENLSPWIFRLHYAAPEIIATTLDNAEPPNLLKIEEMDLRTDADALELDDFTAHGRSADIFSLGCIFFELLACLVEQDLPFGNASAEIPQGKRLFSNRVSDLEAWARPFQEHDQYPELATLFSLAVKMISTNPCHRPTADHIVNTLASGGSLYFCSPCSQSILNRKGNNLQASQSLLTSLSRSASPEKVAQAMSEEVSPVGSKELQSPLYPLEEVPPPKSDTESPSTISQKPVVNPSPSPPPTETFMENESEPGDLEQKLPAQEQFDSSDDDDDLASVFSSRSTAYASSLSSLASNGASGLQDTLEELASLFLDDVDLSNLLNIALQRNNAQAKFVSKFRTLLMIYGRELRQEAVHGTQEATAKVIQAKATYLATRIQQTWTDESNRDDQVSQTRNDLERKAARSVRVQNVLNTTIQSEPYIHEADNEDEDEYHSDSSPAEEEIDINPDAPYMSLKALKGFMTSSRAFDHLRKGLWRMVFPNPLRGIRDIISNAFKSSSEVCTATFNVHWPVQAYIATELGYDLNLKHKDRVLNNVLTITGVASRAYADTAEAYVRWKWPKAKVKVIELIDVLLKARSRGMLTPNSDRTSQVTFRDIGEKSPVIYTDSCSLNFASEDPERMLDVGILSVQVRGSVTDLVEVAQQFAWLSASFREPREGHVSYSEISFKESGRSIYEIRPMELEEVRPRESACWLPIFVNGIIARGFPVPPRQKEERGIELPFQVMISLVKVMYPISHLGGFYLKGFSSILFPTAISADRKSVQWHVIMPSGHKGYLPPGTTPPSEGNNPWVKSDNFEVFTSADRTFLGYARSIEAHIGTDSTIAGESVRTTMASGAYDENPAIAIEVNKIQTGTSGLGFWGFQAGADILYPKGLYYAAETGWYIDMLDIAKVRPLIIYDHAEESKRAWLVPTLSAVLYMAHVWARDKQNIRQLPVAQVDWDAGEAAYRAIKKHSKDELRDSLETDKQYLVRDLIARLLICIEKLLEVEAKARSEPGRTVSLETSTKLYGWDLLGIAQADGYVRRQQLNVDQDWRLLGEDLAVLFCQNIGELVRPTSNVKLCEAADPARLKQDRLIAPVKCLRWLSDKRGKPADSPCLRLGNQVFWQSPGISLFDDCADCLRSSRRRHQDCAKKAQQIIRKDCPGQKSAPPPIEGAVGFGTRKLHKSSLKLTLDNSSLSQSQSTETQVTSISAAKELCAPPAINEIEVQKTRRKWRKRWPFKLLLWK